jgi:hypothetical protein
MGSFFISCTHTCFCELFVGYSKCSDLDLHADGKIHKTIFECLPWAGFFKGSCGGISVNIVHFGVY